MRIKSKEDLNIANYADLFECSSSCDHSKSCSKHSNWSGVDGIFNPEIKVYNSHNIVSFTCKTATIEPKF